MSSSLSSWSAQLCLCCFLALVPLVPGPGCTADIFFFFADIFFKDGTNEGLGTGILELFIKSYVLIEVGGENKFGVQCFISAGCQTLRAVYSGSSCSEVL